MTNIRLILYSIAAIVLLIVILAWNKKEYGESYSEQQRKIWNEWFSHNEREHKMPFDWWLTGTGKTERTFVNRLERLCGRHPSFWAIDWSRPPCKQLSLEGLTEEELIDRIRRDKDANACLELAFRPDEEGFAHPYSFSNYERAKTHLNEAVRLDRPGAALLLSVLRFQEAKLPTGRITNDYVIEKTSIDPDMIDAFGYLPGSREFAIQIRAGDLPLFKAALSLYPYLALTHFYHDVYSGIERRQSDGDPEAERDLCELELLYAFFYGRHVMPEEMRTPKTGISLWLSRFLETEDVTGHSPEWDKTLSTARKLKKLADRGDLHAMYLWLAHGTRYYRYFGRDDWHSLFDYVNTLLRCGHQAMLAPGFESSPAYLIVDHYYADGEPERVRNAFARQLVKRGGTGPMFQALFPVQKHTQRFILAGTQRDDVMPLLERLYKVSPYFLTHGLHYRYIFVDAVDQAIRNRAYEMISETAAAGSPQAQFALADILAHGLYGTADKERACRLLEGIGRHPVKFVTLYEYGDGTTRVFVDQPFCLLMSLALDDDIPGYGPDTIYRIVMENLDKRHACRRKYYYAGLIHERGIGTERNLAKAISFYEKAEDGYDSHALLQLGHLYERGIGVDRDLNKALEYYLMGKELWIPDILDPMNEPEAPDISIERVKRLLQEERVAP